MSAGLTRLKACACGADLQSVLRDRCNTLHRNPSCETLQLPSIR